jgi:hypothetical protein
MFVFDHCNPLLIIISINIVLLLSPSLSLSQRLFYLLIGLPFCCSLDFCCYCLCYIKNSLVRSILPLKQG